MDNIQSTKTRQPTVYFAYGSNMDQHQMAHRCPTAAMKGIAQLHGWRMRIDARGVATIDAAPNTVTYGLLWALSPADEAALDRYEGVGAGYYERRTLPVTIDETTVDALVYVGTGAGTGCPRTGYLERIIKGAITAGLPQAHIDGLAALGGRL